MISSEDSKRTQIHIPPKAWILNVGLVLMTAGGEARDGTRQSRLALVTASIATANGRTAKTSKSTATGGV